MKLCSLVNWGVVHHLHSYLDLKVIQDLHFLRLFHLKLIWTSRFFVLSATMQDTYMKLIMKLHSLFQVMSKFLFSQQLCQLTKLNFVMELHLCNTHSINDKLSDPEVKTQTGEIVLSIEKLLFFGSQVQFFLLRSYIWYLNKSCSKVALL